MASQLLAGTLRSCSRHQGTASNLLNRCWLATTQQQTIVGQSHLHTVSFSGLTHGSPSKCAASAQPGPQSQATPQLVNLRHFRTTAAPYAKKDFYEVLGVAKDASDSDIKKSYYKLAKQYHPDSNKGDDKAQKKFQEVSEAYDTLKDSSKRSMYDQVGPEGMDNMGGYDGSQGGFGGFGGGGFRQATPEEMGGMFGGMFGGGSGGSFADFADLFAQQQRQAQMQGSDVQAQMRITLREAAEGVKKTLHIPIRNIQGKRETRKVEIDIPAGIDSGQTLRLDGEGGAPAIREGIPGNLFVEVSVAADPVLRRQGPHLHVSIDLDFVDAILGGDSKVATLTGVKELSIRPGTQPGDRLRMKGLGMPHLSGFGQGFRRLASMRQSASIPLRTFLCNQRDTVVYSGNASYE
ncbi:hypothetical protein WJX82_004669 [Trebouxia sp. C0006]